MPWSTRTTTTRRRCGSHNNCKFRLWYYHSRTTLNSRGLWERRQWWRKEAEAAHLVKLEDPQIVLGYGQGEAHQLVIVRKWFFFCCCTPVVLSFLAWPILPGRFVTLSRHYIILACFNPILVPTILDPVVSSSRLNRLSSLATQQPTLCPLLSLGTSSSTTHASTTLLFWSLRVHLISYCFWC